ncbi:MAG: PstS family phosphate ABC transporter substrate-binding protein [Anaerolineae bacterium]|jgi:phosphate transport system substrate-binding protein
MQTTPIRRVAASAIVGLLLAALLSACAPTQPATPAATPAAPTAPAQAVSGIETDPLEVTGDVVTAGSSTVFPLAERLAERFQDEGYSGNITIDSIGSGAGLERFCVTGETDVANASRAIKASERESCQAIGREPLELRLGTDALAVVVSKDNDFITTASIDELAAIFSDAAVKWSDVNPAWPNEDIQRFIPGTDSGTFDYFVEEVFAKDKASHLNAANTQLSEDDNVLVQGVLGSPYAIGYFGYAYYAENADRLNVLAIEGVTPTNATVDDNSYPLSRPLYMYTDAGILKAKPQVASYLDFVLTHVNEEIESVGYFAAPAAALDEARAALQAAVR